MFKITTVTGENESVTLRLEGRLGCASVGLLERLCERYATEQGKAVVLDCTEVTFIDRAGLEMLGRIKNERITIKNGSPFIKALIGLRARN